MLLYALRRLIYLVPVAFGVSLLVFALVHLAPGDPISAIVPPDAPQEVVDKLKEYYGFDKPLPIQYLRWLGVTLTGDFGTSIGTGRPVATEVASAFGNSIILAIATTLLAKGMRAGQILRHVLKNAAPTCLAVMGLQAGNLIGGSILIETVFAWPGTGFLLNSAIFRRDLPILQGTTLVLAFFFMLLNLTVDVIQTMVDPRIKRG